MFHQSRLRGLFSLAALPFALFLSGCHGLGSHRAVAAAASRHRIAPVLVAMRPVNFQRVQPNEAGEIPILEYHDLVTTTKVTGYQYPAAKFRADMDWLYAHHYRPISLSDYVQGRIDVPAGITPFVLTFDDALRGQFHYLPNGTIDPNCAVGILESLHAKHSDWPLKATFFVLTNYDPKMPPPFYQKDSAKQKMAFLVQQGFEIGNHTVHHAMGMQHFPQARVEAEFAGAVAGIHRYLPNYDVDTLALPYGVYPKSLAWVKQGASGGVAYHNICAMLAGANPAPSPMSRRFNPYRLPRIIPGNEIFALKYWLDYLQVHKLARFISDGDPNTFTVRIADKSTLDLARLRQKHYFLRTYPGQINGLMASSVSGSPTVSR